ncbi:MAG: hybrid sensor histidine kinase/response regulator [Candidatus Kryptoniota bacterium]
MILVATILDFIYNFFPFAVFSHLAFRVGISSGRSHGSVPLIIGSSLIVSSYVFKIFVILSVGNLDALWMFILNFVNLIGFLVAFGGIYILYGFMSRLHEGNGTKSKLVIRTAALILFFYTTVYLTYYNSIERSFYWKLAGFLYVVNEIVVFSSIILVTGVFSSINDESGRKLIKFMRVLAGYYLVEPVIWLLLVRLGIIKTHGYTVVALWNIISASVGFSIALLTMRIIRVRFSSLMRDIRTTYIEELRRKVLRDLYGVGTGLMVFILTILLVAQSLYSSFRIGMLNSYGEMKLSVSRFVSDNIRSSLDNVQKELESVKTEGGQIDKSLEEIWKSNQFLETTGAITSKGKSIAEFGTNRNKMSGLPADFYEKLSSIQAGTVLLNGRLFEIVERRTKNGGEIYFYALVNMKKLFDGSVRYFNLLENNFIVLSSDGKIVFSSNKNEIGKTFKEVVESRGVEDASAFNDKVASLLKLQSEGFSVIPAETKLGIEKSFILTVTPISMPTSRFALASLENEDVIYGLFVPVFPLMVLTVLLLFGLVGGGVVLLFVAFRWSIRLESEVQSKVRDLQIAEERYRGIVENPYFGSFVFVDGRIVFCNKRLASIFETDVVDIMARGLTPFINLTDLKRLESIFEDLMKNNQPGIKWETKAVSDKGNELFLSGYSTIIQIGENRGIQSVVIDSTAEHHESEKLEKFQRLESMATLAAGIAHDFNNILQVVLVSSQLLQRKLDNPDLRKFADNIVNVASRGKDLSKRLLTFSRQRGLDEQSVFDVNEIIIESLPLFEETFPRTIKIETQLSKIPLTVTGDQSQIQQVIFNLAINARDAMPNGGVLTLRTEIRLVSSTEAELYQVSSGKYACIVVKDTGEGIPPDLMSKIFEPFFTTKSPGKGTGLGLSVVYGIVRSHDGFIKPYSEVGRGTVFYVYLPMSEGIANTGKHEGGETGGSRPHTATILLADDEPGIREAAGTILHQAGYKVLTAADGRDALQLYMDRHEEIDLVILDLNMPELSGRDVLESLTIINPDVRVIIATGYITSEERAGLKGVVEVLEKPFDFDELLKKVGKVL